MNLKSSILALLVPLSLSAQRDTAPRAAPPPTLLHYDVHDLPLVEVQPTNHTAAAAARTASESTLVVMITGDGDWADIDRQIAASLADAGAAVVGLKARAYLEGGRRTPDAAARDVERILRHYLPLWNRDRVALVGYSRGADLMPFVAARLPADLRARVGVVAMFGLGSTGNFTFHWSDLVTDKSRPDDLPVAPELARLRGTRLLCVYGSDEKDSGCRDADPSLGMERLERGGAHHFDKNYPALAALVLKAMSR